MCGCVCACVCVCVCVCVYRRSLVRRQVFSSMVGLASQYNSLKTLWKHCRCVCVCVAVVYACLLCCPKLCLVCGYEGRMCVCVCVCVCTQEVAQRVGAPLHTVGPVDQWKPPGTCHTHTHAHTHTHTFCSSTTLCLPFTIAATTSVDHRHVFLCVSLWACGYVSLYERDFGVCVCVCACVCVPHVFAPMQMPAHPSTYRWEGTISVSTQVWPYSCVPHTSGTGCSVGEPHRAHSNVWICLIEG